MEELWNVKLFRRGDKIKSYYKSPAKRQCMPKAEAMEWGENYLSISEVALVKFEVWVNMCGDGTV